MLKERKSVQAGLKQVKKAEATLEEKRIEAQRKDSMKLAKVEGEMTRVSREAAPLKQKLREAIAALKKSEVYRNSDRETMHSAHETLKTQSEQKIEHLEGQLHRLTLELRSRDRQLAAYHSVVVDARQVAANPWSAASHDRAVYQYGQEYPTP